MIPHTLLLDAVIPAIPASTNKKYRADRFDEFRSVAVPILREAKHNKKPCPYPVMMTVVVGKADCDLYRYDLDNTLKCLQDSLEQAGVIADDAQIVNINAMKDMGDVTSDYTNIKIETVEG